MANLSDLRPDDPVSLVERKRNEEAAEQRADDIAPDFFSTETAEIAVETNWLAIQTLKQLVGKHQLQGTFDENFRFDPQNEEHATVIDGVPNEHLEIFEDTFSLEHAQFIREKYNERISNEERLGAMGFTGFAASALAAVLDPSALAIAAASEGIAAPLLFSEKVSRLGRIGRGALVAGGANAAIEGALAAEDPLRGVDDVLFAAGAGMVLGGALGGVMRPRMPEDGALSLVGRRIQQAVEQTDEQVLASSSQSLHKTYDFSDTLDDAEIASLQAGESSAGAQQSPFRVEPLSESASDKAFDAVDAPEATGISRAGFSMVSQLLRSKNPLTRKLGPLFGEYSIGFKNARTPFSASEEGNLILRRFTTQFNQISNPAYREWAQEQGIGFLGRSNPVRRQEFMSEVTEAIRHAPGEYTDNAAINRTADKVREINREVLSEAKRAGVKGFEDIAEDINYTARILNPNKVEALRQQVGDDVMRQFIQRAIIRGSDEIDDAAAARIAKEYLKTITHMKVGLESSFAVRGANDIREFMVDVLTHEGSSTEAAEALVDDLIGGSVPEQEGGRISRAKRRTRLDETFTMDVPEKGVTLKFSDFLENDQEFLLGTYLRQVGGAIGLAKHADIKSRGDFNRMLDEIRLTSPEFGNDAASEAELFETMYDVITGRPTGNLSDNQRKWLKRAMDIQFIRVMNQVGVAQIAEFGPLVGQVGLRAMFQQMPTFKNFVRRARTGKIDDELADELETIFGIGTERIRHQATHTRFDEFGAVDSRGLQGVDLALETGKRLTTEASLFNSVNTVLQRWAGRSIVQKFATGKFGYTGKSAKQRLLSLGLTDEMAGRIQSQIGSHTDFAESFFGRKVQKLNMDKWYATDPEAADAFIQAVDRFTRRVVQANDVGNLNKWMTKPAVRMLTQFRTFMLVAWEKQFLHGVKMGDLATFTSFTTSMFFGGLAYVGQQHVNAIGRGDRERFLRERLSTEAIAASAFQRSAWSSLMPAGIDTGLGVMGFDPVFRFGRTTGLGTGFTFEEALGNPTFDFGNKLVQTGGALAQAAIGTDPLTKRDLRTAAQLLPFQNAFGLKNFYQALIDETNLPSR